MGYPIKSSMTERVMKLTMDHYLSSHIKKMKYRLHYYAHATEIPISNKARDPSLDV